MGRSTKKSLLTAPALELCDGTDLEAAQQQIKAMIRSEAGAMVRAAIDKAKAGQYQVTKYLFEIAGLYPAIVEQADEGDLSLARILWDQLGFPEGKEKEEGPQSKSGSADANPRNGHALE